MDAKELRIAIVGATGLVGKRALKLLYERGHLYNKIVLMASARSAGKELPYGDRLLKVIEATPDAFVGIDIAFISATKEVSAELAPEAVKRGCLVIDDSAVFRMREDVPLVVPEVNSADVSKHEGIIAIPNCTTTPLVMVLAALKPLGIIKRVIVSTYQAVSGAGARALSALESQIYDEPPRDSVDPASVFAFNVIPAIGAFNNLGVTDEEEKMVRETAKILHTHCMVVEATCVRVPVRVGHSEAVTIDFDSDEPPVGIDGVRTALARFPGIVVWDPPSVCQYPMPITVEGRSEVFVGRIRIVRPGSFALFLSCDNLLRGAAWNALQILDEVVKWDALKPRSQRSPGPEYPDETWQPGF